MNFKKIRRIFYAFTYGFFGIILAIILIRVLLRLIGANDDAAFVKMWYSFSDGFLGIFKGMYPDLNTTSGILYIETYAIIGMVFYLLLALILSKALTSVLAVHPLNILKNIIDTLFKIIESLLIIRFIFKLTAASTTSSFVDFIYNSSAFIHDLFVGILPTITIKEYNLIFETSTLIAIIIIIIFDIITEGIINRMYKAVTETELIDESKPRRGYHKVEVDHQMSHSVPQPIIPASQPAPNSSSNITINIPQQVPTSKPMVQQPPTYVDNRSIKVFPNTQVPNTANVQQYPGYIENGMQNQNPPSAQQQPNQYSGS